MTEVFEEVETVLNEILSLVETQSHDEFLKSYVQSPVFDWPQRMNEEQSNVESDDQIEIEKRVNNCTSNNTTLKASILNYWKLESLNGVSTPLKNSSLKMGCDTPFQQLLQTFSPTISKCFEEEMDFNEAIDYKFLRKISPSNIMQYLSEFKEHDVGRVSVIKSNVQTEQDGVYEAEQEEEEDCTPIEGTTQYQSSSQSNDNNPGYYPGSMLNANPEGFMGCPSVLENYLDPHNERETEKQNFPTTKYEEEIMSSSNQNMWQNMNAGYGYNYHNYSTENMLPPVMLSSHQEILNLQHDLQNLNGVSENFVLPIYFQPFSMPQQNIDDKCYDEKTFAQQQYTAHVNNITRENIRKMYYQAQSTMDQKTSSHLTEIEKSSEAWVNTINYDEDLLKKCQMACMESEQYNTNHPISPSSLLPTLSMHNDSMKYLEEAAVKLLQGSIKKEKLPRKRGQYIKSEHPDSLGKYQCRICDKWFNRIFTLQTHERVHSGSKPFQCELCGMQFRQSGTKRNHIRAIHARVKPYKCEFCSKHFGHKSSLVVHRRIHTKEKPYECELCGRRFTDRATFKKHEPTHSREKRFRCDICGKCLTQQSNLKRHIKTIHKEEESLRLLKKVLSS